MSIANKKYYDVNPSAAKMIDQYQSLVEGKKPKTSDIMFGVRTGGLTRVPKKDLILIGERCLTEFTKIRNRKPGSLTVTAKWMVSWGIKGGWITESK